MFSLPLLHRTPGALCRLNSTAVIPLKQRSVHWLLYMSTQTKTTRTNDNVCTFPQHLLQKTLRTVIAAKWFAIRGIRLISQTKEDVFVSLSHGSWVIRLQKDTFQSLGFHFLVTDFPISVTNSMEFILLRKFRFIFYLESYSGCFPPTTDYRDDSLMMELPVLCPKMVRIRLIGKSKLPPGASMPKKVVC